MPLGQNKAMGIVERKYVNNLEMRGIVFGGISLDLPYSLPQVI